MFAKIENGIVTEWPIPSITVLFPNISFPEVLSEKSMPDGYVMVGSSVPPAVGLNQRAVPGMPVKREDKWIQGWDIVDISQEEINEQTQALAASVRLERDQKMMESDWVIMKAYELQIAPPKDWVDYRQALRDITTQPKFPQDIVWPVKP
jgi:hypothetical protein